MFSGLLMGLLGWVFGILVCFVYKIGNIENYSSDVGIVYDEVCGLYYFVVVLISFGSCYVF